MSKLVEEWRPVGGYEGLYEVSDWGRVKSLDRVIEVMNILFGSQIRHLKEKYLKPKVNSSNRLQVRLWKDGVKEQKQIHVIVAEAFIPNPNGYDVVHHIDHNPFNNRVENLVWMSKEEHSAMHSTERCRDAFGKWIKN